MTPPRTAGPEGHCGAEPRCERAPCFRVEVHVAPDRAAIAKATDTCADHLGDTVQALAQWASARELTDGYLQAFAIDSANALPFATIPLGPAASAS